MSNELTGTSRKLTPRVRLALLFVTSAFLSGGVLLAHQSELGCNGCGMDVDAWCNCERAEPRGMVCDYCESAGGLCIHSADQCTRNCTCHGCVPSARE